MNWKRIAILAATAVLAAHAAAQTPDAATSGGPTFDIARFVVEGNTLLKPAQIQRATAPFVGKGKSFADVQRALEVVEKLYTDAGYSAVQVLLPEQELEKGEVKLQAVEARVGKIIVEGNKFFSERNVRRSIPAVREGISPNVEKVSKSLRLANENPSKQTNVLLRGSDKEGEVDVVARIADERPWKVSLSLDNTGTSSTGLFRTGLALQHSNMFDLDHVAVVQYVTSPTDIHDVSILGMGYHIPIYRLGDSVDLTAGYSNVNSGTLESLGGQFGVSGSGGVFGLRYNHNLDRWKQLEHKVVIGLDHRAYHNDITTGGGPSLVPDITVHPLSVTYNGTWRETTSEIGVYLTAAQNLPGGNDGTTAAFADPQQRNGGPAANYFVWRWGANYARAFNNDWQIKAAWSVQATNDMLISGEQFGLGGADSVRAFVEREIAFDHGHRASVELYTPDFGNWFPGNTVRSRLLLFYDAGAGSLNATQQGTPCNNAHTLCKASISSVGVGWRASYSGSLSVRLDLGMVMDGYRNPPNETGGQGQRDGRLHGSFSYIF